MEAFAINQILSWSPTAISAVLLIGMALLIKRTDKNEKAQIERTNNLRACIEKDLAEIKADTTKSIEENARRISNIELEYIRRDTFYRDLGGWKDDINRLSGQLSEITKNIIELWKVKKD